MQFCDKVFQEFFLCEFFTLFIKFASLHAMRIAMLKNGYG